MLENLRLRRPHPGYETLSALADRELPAAEAMRINAHLAECPDCREEVDFMVELRERLRDLTGPPLPRNLLPEITSLRHMGERMILEGEEPRAVVRPTRQWLRVVSAAAVVLGALGTMALFRPGDAEAGASTLTITNGAPGRRASVVFRTAGALADRRSLVVRVAEYEGGSSQGGVATPLFADVELSPKRVGEFETSLPISSSTVFAEFVVESPDGERIERGHRDPWEFLARFADGRPTPEALFAKAQVRQRQLDLRGAYKTAQTLVDLYPERPAAWALYHFLQGRVGAAPDSTVHVARLDRFIRDLSSDVNPGRLAELIRYAQRINPEKADSIGTELERIAPGHPVAVDRRVRRMAREYRDTPARHLRALDREWDAYGQATTSLLRTGFRVSVRARNAAAAVRWGRRWYSNDTGSGLEIARQLTSLADADARGEAGRILRALLRVDSSKSQSRALGATTSDQVRVEREKRKQLLTVLGELLLVQDSLEAAYKVLEEAATSGWDHVLMQRLAGLAERLGYARAELDYRQLAAADPINGVTYRRVHRARMEALRSAGVTSSMRNDVTATIARRIFDQPSRSWRGPVDLETRSGERRSLSSLVGVRGAVVHFWHPWMPGQFMATREIAAACRVLETLGVSLIIVSRHPVDHATWNEKFVPEGCTDPWFVDGGRQAVNALQPQHFPQTLVLDEEGDVRLLERRFTDAVRASHMLTELP
ncbi:MAG: zf-HC2 domain-containing protein [Gemmatimonadetes bacterium]|nr:zf-HC2 domain-containing protein [Gemmatimonadota bacterium]